MMKMGLGLGFVESLGVVSAVAIWRGGQQDKAGCWYLHVGSSWGTQVSVGGSGCPVAEGWPSYISHPDRQPLSGPQGTHQEERRETRF